MKITQELEAGKSAIARVLTPTILVLISIIATLLIAELALRIVPIPGVEFNVSTYDDITGSGLYPDSKLMYQNDRGDTASRRINSFGYPDIEHEAEKQNGITRIGFFGDSYTEARQVELDETFFRQVQTILGDSNVETLSFGVSGYSTLQSYLTYEKWGKYFELDLIIYVFVENDPGDNVPELKGNAPIPYPVLTDSGFSIDNSFRSSVGEKRGLADKAGDYLTSRSLVLSTISERLRLLQRYGIKFGVTEEDRWMATKREAKQKNQRLPTSDDLPSTWPNDLREHASNVTEAILTKWSHDVRNRKQHFAIVYVPRAQEMSKASAQQDSWKLWLESYCDAHQISFLDPSADLLEAESRGEEVFYDHFTKEGHKVFATSFAEWFRRSYPQFAVRD